MTDSTNPSEEQPKKTGSRERDLIEQALNDLPLAETVAPESTPPMMSDDLPAPGTFPGYDIIREIHRGGQGVVYLALQRATKRKVAIKVMHEGATGGSAGRVRFEREVQILAQLNHPSIVKIHDSGITETHGFYYVMDYISGRSLDEVMRDRDAWNITEALRMFSKICEAVNAAHLKGVIHRDLKPANVRIDTAGEPIVVDFGLAKVALPDIPEDESGAALMTVTGHFIGSLPWASPEQARGSSSAIDTRSDVYSLGVILYQLLTGRFPYTVIGNMRDVLDNIMQAEPARPSTVRKKINDEVETIVLKCLSKEPGRRYQSAGEVARDIARYMAGQPIEAKRDSGLYVLSKMIGRHRATAVFAGVMLVSIVAFSIVMTGMYLHAKELERAAIAAKNDANDRKDEAEKARDDERKAKELAQKNFKSLWEGVRVVVFDVYDQLAPLRGSTPSRDSILTYVGGMLDSLSLQGGEDPAFLREVGELHERYGDLHSQAYMPNVGGVDVAAQSVEKAQRFYMDSAAIKNDPRTDLAIADNLLRRARLAQQRKAFDDAQQLSQRALSTLDTARTKVGGDDALLEQIEAERMKAEMTASYITLRRAEEEGDELTIAAALRGAIATHEAAEAYWRRAYNADQTDMRAAREVGVAMDTTADLVLRSARTAEVAARALERSGDPAAGATLSRALELMDDARTRALAAAAWFAAVREGRPQFAQPTRDESLAYLFAGDASFEIGATHWRRNPTDPPGVARAEAAFVQAIEDLTRARKIAEALAQDEMNIEAMRDLALVLNKLGNCHRERAEIAEQMGDEALRGEQLDLAVGVFAESLRLRAQVVATDPSARHRRDHAVGHVKLGEMREVLGDPASALTEIEAAEKILTALYAEGIRGQVKSDLDAIKPRSDRLRGVLPSGSP